MRTTTKITLTGVLILVFLLTLGVVVFGISFGSWLHTYQPLTNKMLVAKVLISGLKEDSGGKYLDVSFQPYQYVSAFTYIFSPNVTSYPAERQDFKLYGDSVHIGGPIINLYPNSALFNYPAMFRLTTIFGRYDLDPTAEAERKVNATYTLNGGSDSTTDYILNNQDNWPVTMFVDRAMVNTPAPVAPTSQTEDFREYDIYATKDGFVPERTK